MESNSIDLVTLQLDDRNIECSRQLLIENSDYFRAMFQGGFIESRQESIKIKNVCYADMKKIIEMSCDANFQLQENIIPVLHTACMLQFLEIRNRLLNQLASSLSTENCLEIWMAMDLLNIEKYSQRAKFLALMEFDSVRHTDFVLEMSLQSLCEYLRNVNLQTKNEMDIFYLIQKWYEHCNEENEQMRNQLLACCDFTTLSIENLRLMNSIFKTDVIACAIALKTGSDVIEKSDSGAQYLMKNEKHRRLDRTICVLALSIPRTTETPLTHQDVVYVDAYKRKRNLRLIQEKEQKASLFYLDLDSNKMKKLTDLDPQYIAHLEGFRMVGHKQFIYLFGGEVSLGRGRWNRTLLIYDIINESWRTEAFPHKIRHFEVCVGEDNIYIIGGTGEYRVIRDTIVWYNCTQGTWHIEYSVPTTLRQIKCCCYGSYLILLNLSQKMAYTYCTKDWKWTHYKIRNSTSETDINYSDNMYLFTYDSFLFLNDKDVIYNLHFQDEYAEIVNYQEISPLSMTCVEVRSLFCNDSLYMLAVCQDDEDKREIVVLKSANVKVYKTYPNGIFNGQNLEINRCNEECFTFHTSDLHIFDIVDPRLPLCKELINEEFVQNYRIPSD